LLRIYPHTESRPYQSTPHQLPSLRQSEIQLIPGIHDSHLLTPVSERLLIAKPMHAKRPYILAVHISRQVSRDDSPWWPFSHFGPSGCVA